MSTRTVQAQAALIDSVVEVISRYKHRRLIVNIVKEIPALTALREARPVPKRELLLMMDQNILEPLSHRKLKLFYVKIFCSNRRAVDVLNAVAAGYRLSP